MISLISDLTTLSPIKASILNNSFNYLLKYCKSKYSTLTVITYFQNSNDFSLNHLLHLLDSVTNHKLTVNISMCGLLYIVVSSIHHPFPKLTISSVSLCSNNHYCHYQFTSHLIHYHLLTLSLFFSFFFLNTKHSGS